MGNVTRSLVCVLSVCLLACGPHHDVGGDGGSGDGSTGDGGSGAGSSNEDETSGDEEDGEEGEAYLGERLRRRSADELVQGDARALELAEESRPSAAPRMRGLRDRLESQLLASVPGLEVTGHRAHRGAFFGSESARTVIVAERA